MCIWMQCYQSVACSTVSESIKLKAPKSYRINQFKRNQQYSPTHFSEPPLLLVRLPLRCTKHAGIFLCTLALKPNTTCAFRGLHHIHAYTAQSLRSNHAARLRWLDLHHQEGLSSLRAHSIGTIAESLRWLESTKVLIPRRTMLSLELLVGSGSYYNVQ